MIHDIDVKKTQEKIEQFRQDNKDLIAANTSKQVHIIN